MGAGLLLLACARDKKQRQEISTYGERLKKEGKRELIWVTKVSPFVDEYVVTMTDYCDRFFFQQISF